MYILLLVASNGYFLPKVLGNSVEDIISKMNLEDFPREEVDGRTYIYPNGWAPVYYRISYLQVI